ncbi:tetracycline regulation of excision, RteC [Ginsengibacter hankyongi]|uniref:Tetracycline regulation of excision, RteC n=1 Tax=Ginsengibacter hankyongi TaxID=2607284 RepID=A0A5J5IIY1_9BACT|nr:RteC domain-containing protein [Ginsengibacter hankyongi]KAA9038707.1 tetracycline regulation of excision, RteC [Ginsengibacter hankyongi]
MSVSEFTISLYEEMELSLAEIGASSGSDLQKFRLSSHVILNAISKLKAFVQNYKFTTKEEEINFFKHQKPKFYSKLIYHQKLARIQSHLPISAVLDSRSYYLNELRKINDYLNDNYEFLTYYRSQATSMDEMYFLRKEPDSWLLMNFEEYETDLSFSTVYDHKISKIIAYELLSEFINSTLAKLEIQRDLSGGQPSLSRAGVNWTGSKVSLVELLYALQSAGSCNNGTIDLKQLASHFEALFNIDLGNYYRVFQEMRIRKINRTTFLDQLKERLIQRMDETDENPKFK